VNLISEATQTFKPTNLNRARDLDYKWTPALGRVIARYPTVTKSKFFSAVSDLAQKGEIEKAMLVAKATEDTPQKKFRSDLARRNRVERLRWFNMIKEGEKNIKDLFTALGIRIGDYIEKHGDNPNAIPRVTNKISDEMKEFRRELSKIVNGTIRRTPKLALKIKGDAVKPIMKKGLKEAVEETGTAISVGGTAVTIATKGKELLDKFKPGFKLIVKKRLATRRVAPKVSSLKWQRAQKRVLKNVLKKNITGQTPTRRIWDLAQGMEQIMRREVASGIMKGTSAQRLAKQIKKYTSPAKIKTQFDAGMGQGVYKTPFKNAVRIARTEANRAYSKASAEFAKTKPWVTGIQINVSAGATDHCDYCIAMNGTTYTVQEFEELVDSGAFPFHPQCMCYETEIIDDEYLDKEEVA